MLKSDTLVLLQLLTLIRERPPRQWIAALHEVDNRHEHIDHTRIVLFPGFCAQPIKHLKRIPSDQLPGMLDADQPKVRSHGLSDVGEVFQTGDCFSVRGFHGMSIVKDKEGGIPLFWQTL